MIKNKKLKKNIMILILVFVLTLIFIILLTNQHLGKTNNDEIKLNFKSRVEKLNSFDSEDYFKIGWLQVQGTNIDLPILDFRSATDNDIDFSYAWLNSNSTTGQNRQVINGHNILNVSSTPLISDENFTDFESLMAFSYYSFAKDNLYIQYTQNNKDEIYLIYGVGFYDYLYDSDYSTNDLNKLTEYIKDVKNNSIYDYDIDVKATDDLIALKTCTRYFGATEKQSFVINARRLRNDEKIIKYKVTTNKLFDELFNNDKKG